MLILAIDSATVDLVIGVVDATTGEVLADNTQFACRDHHERLVPAVQEALAAAGKTFADLDGVVVGQGPGPFTGLRVGMATGQAFAHARNIPVYPVCTHDAIAHQVARDHSTAHPDVNADDILVVTDARRREVYWRQYENLQPLSDPAVTKPADVSALLKHRPTIVSCPENLREALSLDDEVQWVSAAPTPWALVAAADLDDPEQPLIPLYLRRPDAVAPKPQPLSPAVRLPEGDLK